MLIYSCYYFMSAVAYAKSFRGGGKVSSQSSFALAKTALFCFTFLGSEGGRGTVASPLGRLVHAFVKKFVKILGVLILLLLCIS